MKEKFIIYQFWKGYASNIVTFTFNCLSEFDIWEIKQNLGFILNIPCYYNNTI